MTHGSFSKPSGITTTNSLSPILLYPCSPGGVVDDELQEILMLKLKGKIGMSLANSANHVAPTPNSKWKHYPGNFM